jgi:F0F1-type ATP synthase membrane subunit b/b'
MKEKLLGREFHWLMILTFLSVIIVLALGKFFEYQAINSLKYEFINEINKNIVDSKSKTLQGLETSKAVTLNISNNVVLKDAGIAKNEFIEKYYIAQSNWLTFWLTFIGVIGSILVIAIPYLIKRKWEEQEDEYREIINNLESDIKKNKERLESELQKDLDSHRDRLKEELSEIAQQDQENYIYNFLEESKDDINERFKSLSIEHIENLNLEASNIADEMWLHVTDEQKEKIKAELIKEIREELKNDK